MLSTKTLLLSLVVSALACVDAAPPSKHAPRHRHTQTTKPQVTQLDNNLLPVPIKDIFEFAASQYEQIYSTWFDSAKHDQFPNDGHASDKAWSTVSVSSTFFVTAFFPGALWQLYSFLDTLSPAQPASRVDQPDWLDAAQRTTAVLEPISHNTQTHDIGFIILASFGDGLALTGNKSYIPVINKAAQSLATRFSPIVGCTRSWNSNAPNFLVIIDNMMNIELLFQSAILSSNRTLYDMGFSHANRTMHEHFRPSNHSTYHVVEYDERDGSVIKRMTNQGYADWSTWARGQSWSIHGFTTTYRYTKHEPFLTTAVAAADLFIQQTFSQDRLHKTPFWDFNAPHGNDKDVIYQPKDASAAAIAASGLLELSTFVKDPAVSARLFNASISLLSSLIDNHLNLNNRFGPLPGLLNNCTQGPYHAGDHSHPYDVFFFYGEYYFLQALTRLSKIQSSKSAHMANE